VIETGSWPAFGSVEAGAVAGACVAAAWLGGAAVGVAVELLQAASAMVSAARPSAANRR
jgi:hypothetical protein